MPRVKLLASLGSNEFPEDMHGFLEDEEHDVSESWAAKLVGRQLAIVVEPPPEKPGKKPAKKPDPAPIVESEPVVAEDKPADPPAEQPAADKVVKYSPKETPKADPAPKQTKTS